MLSDSPRISIANSETRHHHLSRNAHPRLDELPDASRPTASKGAVTS
jgi:hypothetical protein